ncbi:MAG: 6-phosphofructokinase [Deltaproteobacteria bacterium RIFOXYA12_FULL_58_15]|nr:MAG: 6-phosphofructokinase [Deltaproteobacteria bacterium RIFOXYA12_FULL_58_15]OGR13236.1 MAG: 6-phosphofructokinase [Deltaproteobacteria bacterium RIFOXYB12_FULL_58_9]
MTKIRRIGILTAGGDAPGLNAAIRAVGKAAIGDHGWEVIGFLQGFTGLIENKARVLAAGAFSGVLTSGGTMLGTSRVQVHRVHTADGDVDMRDQIVATYERRGLDALICIGGGGTHKNALRLVEKGLNVVTLPKTIDNDVPKTDTTIGFDTALGIATDALDRLHSTAHSHHRIIVTEIMGHRAGWLALGAGLAGGADVIALPEIPYDVNIFANAINRRVDSGSPFSIVAVAEGAMSKEHALQVEEAVERKKVAETPAAKKKAKQALSELYGRHANNTLRLANELEGLTGLEARVTILGYVQRGGTPSAGDRILATRFGTAAVDLVNRENFGCMVAAVGDRIAPVPIGDVAGNLNLVTPDSDWVVAARHVGVCLGD